MYKIEEHYRINKNFLGILGLWPYQHLYFTRLQKLLFIGILSGYIIAQLLSLLTSQFSTNLLLKVLSFMFPTLCVTIKYCAFVIQADNVKQLIEQIRDDWKLLIGKSEIDIIKRYIGYVRFITVNAIVFCHFDILCYISFQLLPLMLDIVLPLNESRSLKLIATAEYFLNREKYMWIMLIYEITAIYIRVLAVCSTITMLAMIILHSCALFKVASYRMENAIQEDTLGGYVTSNSDKEYLLYQRIVHVVVIHRRAIAYIDFALSSFTLAYAFLLLIGVSSLSVNLFHLIQLVTVTHDWNEIYAVSIVVIAHFSYMFLINYGGEIVQNHGMEVFDATYNALWYAAPLRIQKLILFVMQRSIVKINLTCGNIFVASLEGFLTLISSAISYFTVIYSTRQ